MFISNSCAVLSRVSWLNARTGSRALSSSAVVEVVLVVAMFGKPRNEQVGYVAVQYNSLFCALQHPSFPHSPAPPQNVFMEYAAVHKFRLWPPTTRIVRVRSRRRAVANRTGFTV